MASTSRPTPKHPPVALDTEGFGSGPAGRDIFFAAVETTRMPMVITDPRLPDNPIVFANNAFLEMTGYSQDEILGHNCRFLQGPDTDPHAVAEVRRHIAAEREYATELLNYRKDGSSFWNALFVTPLRNHAGELIYFFSSQLDVSRRKDAESALGQAQKMEALGQLTGGIAHDFNNLLQLILGNLDVMTRRFKTGGVTDAGLTKALSNAREATRKSAMLTQQLLAFARKQQLRGRVINLNDLTLSTTDLAKRTLGDGITLKTELEPQLWNCRIDPTQAEVALLNLLLNARDAMPGGGLLTIRTENVEVSADDAHAHGVPSLGRFVRIAVTDNGSGIAPELLPRVMDPFFTTKDEGHGTGLGLSMVYGFAKQSGGAANIYSEVGAGTTVRLYFPATSDFVSKPVTTTTGRAAQGDERVLVVDDRREIAEMAAMMLREAGYTAMECGSAREALDLLDTDGPFDLLLTDLIMPGGMNGVMLAREAQARRPDLKVLLMTGFADSTPDRWGGTHYDMIFKPYSQSDLTRKVRTTLDGSGGTS
ncbi:histidine kinase famiy protein [Aquincola tertiaricarbonis]|uniref:histidine kinase n=1 Tax=Aquincola tertiaricarbonis TaxID=391953 RepID=A0ABY4S3P8_AQUTE|nr:histidine kinase famiy protein [Aquincola tertiaricarbonis]URI06416.1 histidine kinase famiy protein [Aquincola tertiaricarbonis]